MSAYTLSRIGIAFIWLYHGLVPKLIFRDATELELVKQAPVLYSAETTVVLAGIAEIMLGILVLYFWRHRWPVWISTVAFATLLVGSFAIDPRIATQAFNPVTLSGSAILFCLINMQKVDD